MQIEGRAIDGRGAANLRDGDLSYGLVLGQLDKGLINLLFGFGFFRILLRHKYSPFKSTPFKQLLVDLLSRRLYNFPINKSTRC
ncbi:hypothetical protein, partial [Enterococcus faecalis]|uniref:hypothetical protein n=1 Tax=Enterococcus faecalis TaxID=1351 RepID=UPI004041FFC5